ncbi:CheR family methyltransferase [Alienimonas californiensis]|uniref:protein-glutamate O-methyltransferase n=1 Tax=Alienimonas californiensis TaxID=2527989 RepID=A0A517PA16_9PLAN|nr:CheR family methyltransferase [Alienimonas californiensis]QDT16221.1 Chemotaxis protein methyltransferase Cher2 [Alienimonas californiensis]
MPERHAPTEGGVPVVGVGASAGGLEAFLKILQNLPDGPGPAFVFLVHMVSEHTSSLPEVLGRVTKMPVRQAADGMRVEPRTVYTNPPDSHVTLEGDVLRTHKRPSRECPLATIDVFMRSLAESRGDKSVAVFLSGADGDGPGGAEAVDSAGGLVLVQDPDSCEHTGLPNGVIRRGPAHLILPPRELADALGELGDGTDGHTPLLPGKKHLTVADGEMSRIFELLREAGGVDYTHYKPATIRRRLQRRMLMHRCETVAEYVARLEEHPEEVERLARDLLIHVTRFFRDPESFKTLMADVFPVIKARRGKDDPFRVWIAGCSTGEEAYSVAIALLEFLGDGSRITPIQIFGTDVSEAAVAEARAGRFGRGIEAEVSPGRLEKFFEEADGGYKIRPAVRDVCVFARQDLTRDPPFSRLDLVLCRNVLIYLGQPLQSQLLGVFHYALKPDGFLMLGSAESVGARSDLFAVADKKHRIFTKKPRAMRPEIDFPVRGGLPRDSGGELRRRRAVGESVHALADKALIKRYAPPGVVVNEELNIVQFRGQTGRFLEAAPGEPNLNLLKMAREGLLHALRGATREAREQDRPIRKEGQRVRFNSHILIVDLEVLPLQDDGKRHFLVLFRERPEAAPAPPVDPAAAGLPALDGIRGGGVSDEEAVEQLQRELLASREHLQSIISDLEASNDELQSANEEILSSNEELQSTNEELDTAKEELQSTNEELNTVNDELHERNGELSQLNADLTNLMANVQLAIVVVGSDLAVRRFTPLAGKLLNLIPGDVGRSIGQIRPDIDCPDLEGLIRKVLNTLEPLERDVTNSSGHTYVLRIRAYQDGDRRVNGAVLSLLDVNDLRARERELAAARDFADAILDTIDQPLVVLDGALTVQRVNRAYRETFEVNAEEIHGRRLYELGDGQWNIASLRTLLEDVLPQNASFDGYEVSRDFPALGRRTMRLNARPLDGDGHREPLILLAFTDTTGAPGEPSPSADGNAPADAEG